MLGRSSLMRRDVSTLPHELSHLFQRQLKGEDADILNRWVGAEDGRWTPKHDERFALLTRGGYKQSKLLIRR